MKRPSRSTVPQISTRALSTLAALLTVLLIGGAASYAQQGSQLHVRGAVNEQKVVETAKTIPIAKPSRQKPRVVATLDPKDLGTIRPGQTVQAFSDVEISVTCLEPMSKCVGSIYHYNPHVKAQLILGQRASSTRGYPIGKPRKITCSQQLPNRNHHCVIPMQRQALVQSGPKLRCSLACHLNVVFSAYHRKSRRNDKVVIGVDSDHGIEQSKASISAAVFNADPKLFTGRELLTSGAPVNAKVPVASHSGSTPDRVIYSAELPSLQQGEMLVADAKARTDISHLPYAVLTQAQLIIGEKRTSTEFTGLPVQVASDNGKVDEQNGYNCTQGKSDFRTPCPIAKGGVVKINYSARTDPRNDKGPPVPLYMNLVVSGAQEYGGGYHKSDAMKVVGGRIRVWRYPARYGG